MHAKPTRHSRPAGRLLPALATLALLVAACGGGAATPAAGTVPPGALTLTATEYEFSPATLTADAGSVTFAVTNGGTENHEFEVLSGTESLGKLDAFGAGSTRTLTVELAAGEYQFACRLNGHDILGMKGTLTVAAG